VEALLEIDTDKYELQYMVALGYRAKEQQPRYRRPFDEVVKFL